MTNARLFSVLLLLLFACNNEQPAAKLPTGDAVAFRREVIQVENKTPTVDIGQCILIGATNEDRKKDAARILDLKRKWPLVMQNPSKAGFDTILAQHFSFAAEGQLLNREDYINDRTQPSDWKITFVRYDNLTLQFFGDIALLTYRNQVTNENVITKETEVEYISWADVYVKEKNEWKIGASHTVDVKVEKK